VLMIKCMKSFLTFCSHIVIVVEVAMAMCGNLIHFVTFIIAVRRHGGPTS